MNVGTEITAWAELRSMIDQLLGEPEALLNTEQAAAYLNIAPESLRRLVRRKAISSVQVLPSEYRFRKEDLEEYVMSRWNRRRSSVR
jgi:excisionase family DNA binding protein